MRQNTELQAMYDEAVARFYNAETDEEENSAYLDSVAVKAMVGEDEYILTTYRYRDTNRGYTNYEEIRPL